LTTIVGLVLLATALPLVLACIYLAVLTLLSAAIAVPPRSSRRLRFDVIVPAHNEADVIARTVASLKRLDWPTDGYRILVIADNCTDATADHARAAGAEALERKEPERRGKGYALEFGFRSSRERGWAQAVVVVDADAEVSTNLLEAFAARIERGAMAVQVHYGVLNPWASWRTQLITIAKAAFHIVRSRARERMGVSCGIRGNGWCVTHELLRLVPYQCFSLTEDLEYGIAIGLAGQRVVYADEAHSNAEMVTVEKVARKQRQRWEEGRFELVRSRTLPLLAAALRPSAICLDLALDLLLLPLSYVALNAVALLLAAAAASRWHATYAPFLGCAIACLAVLLLHVLRGWQLSGMGWRGLLAFARVPGFLVWKILLMLRRKPQGWVRTERERQP